MKSSLSVKDSFEIKSYEALKKKENEGRNDVTPEPNPGPLFTYPSLLLYLDKIGFPYELEVYMTGKAWFI